MAQPKQIPDKSLVLSKALRNASKDLGLNMEQVGKMIGKDRSVITRAEVSPDSKAGELALMFIRIYRSLSAMLGGDKELMKHWFKTENTGTRGVPKDQVMSIYGMNEVLLYLDAIRGKI